MEKSNIFQPKTHCCTFKETGRKYTFQKYVNCLKCFPSSNDGVCMHCYEDHHKDHIDEKNLVIKEGDFFCDCGAESLCAKLNFNKTSESFDINFFSNNIEIENISKAIITLSSKILPSLKKGIAFSPISITFMLSILLKGAVGSTHKELLDFLGKEISLYSLFLNKENYNLSDCKMTNLILVNQNQNVNQNFLNLMNQLVSISSEDFKNITNLVNKINNYVEQNTNGLIKNLINENIINSETIMCIINTLYFKMSWKTPFDEKKTAKKKFNNQKIVDMMHLDNLNIRYLENGDIQLVRIPYIDERYSLVIILPKKNTEDLQSYHKYLKHKLPSNAKCNICIPKFTVKSKINLVPVLQKLGVTKLFTNEAELDKINQQAYISNMIHEVNICINEEGTEACAATEMTYQSKCIGSGNIINFTADHSFIYYIGHIEPNNSKNNILFVGEYHGD